MDYMEYFIHWSRPHTELFDAAITGNLDNFKRLALKHAKGVGIRVPEVIRKCKDEIGRGSLHVAAAGGSLDVCKYTIETLKLDVDSKDRNGITALYFAIGNGHLDIARYLLEKGANADASNDHRNFTPLHFAAKTGDTKIITLLLSRGVRVDVPTSHGTPLSYAAAHRHQDAVKVLLDSGANPNGVYGQGKYTPLMAAVLRKSWECMELLLQAGANPSADSYGNTPLTLAARGEHVTALTRLLEAGADPNYKMSLGLTALEVAAVYSKYLSLGVLFPVTSPIQTYPDWSIAGVLSHISSDANILQREVHMKEKFHQAKSKGRDAFQQEEYLMAVHWFEKALVIFPDDAAVLSNMSACFARLGDGNDALEYAFKCLDERPEWPKAYYRTGVAFNLLKKYDAAVGAFYKGLTFDPRNKELSDAYMKAIEDGLNSITHDSD